LEIGIYDKSEKVLKALASKSRVQILECIERGVSNPGHIAKELKRHRATIEKHLRVLLATKIVEKVPSLTEGGQLTIRYRTREHVKEFLASVRVFSQQL
jgi:DNA-binding transcriptional ArsR family regulator